MRSFAFAATLLASSLFVSAKPTRRYIPNQGGKSELVVYWGGGTNQKPLADFCDDDTIDIIPIGFVNKFPGQDGTYGWPGTDFGNACLATEYYVDTDGHKTSIFNPCSNIQRDMAICQQKGKKILISIGGDTPGNQLASKDAATSFAKQLWEIFGPKPQGFTGPRPFGDNVVDGFDLDIESGDGKFVPDLAASLSALTASDQSKKYYLTAAPQCLIPDLRLSAALTAAPFDHVFVQFYNNPACAARASVNGGSFNWNDWAQWLSANSANKDINMYLGLPASPSAAPSHPDHYLNLDEATKLIESLMCANPYKSQFGGVMLWEATFSENNQQNGKSYAENIKDVFKGCSCYPKPVTSSTTTTTTTTSPSTTASTTTFTTTSSSTTTSTTTPYTHPTTSSTTPSVSSTTTSSATLPSYTPTSSTLSQTSTPTLPPYTPTSSTLSPTSTPTLPPYTPATSSSSTSSTPAGSSSTEHTWEDWTSSTTSTPVKITSTSTTSRTVQITSTSSTPADSTTTSFEHTWEDWTSTTSSASTPVKITSTASSTEHTWQDWTSSTSSTPAVSTTTSSADPSYTWADWPTTSSSSTPAVSTSISSYDPATWADWQSTSSTPAAVTTSSVSTWADWSASSTLSVSVVTQGAGSSLVSPSAGTSKPVSPAAASSSPASSSYPVAPATFTGGAPSDELPGTVLSIAVCVAVAIGGLFL